MRTLLLPLFALIVSVTFSQERIDHFESSYFENQRFAHRGGYALGPENTLQTVLLNLQNGVNAVEIDVQLTKDNQLVLFRDYSVDGLCVFIICRKRA